MDAQTATRTHFCKFNGCKNEASSPVGRYSYCREHQNRRAAGNGTVAQPAPAPVRTGAGSTVKQLQSTLALARQVDAARTKAARATQKALDLKQAADALERRYRERLRDIVT